MQREARFPPVLQKLNITAMERGSFAALLGEAHQYLVSGALMRLGFLVSLFPVRGGTYDIIVVAYEDFQKAPHKRALVRTQVKTLSNNGSLSLVGGRRAGRGMEHRGTDYLKGYKYTTEHNDLIVGVDRNTLDFYFVPTQMTAKWGPAVSRRRLAPLRNRIEVLLNWNSVYLEALGRQIP